MRRPAGTAQSIEKVRLCGGYRHGAGIAPEDLPHIFEPFFTTKPNGAGSGLGLPISQGIIAAHGGEIEARSQPGVGTTFTVRLPARPDGPGDSPPVHAPRPLDV